jgi:hypothetical protein
LAVAAGAGLVLLAIKPVLHDLAALAAHRVVGLRHQHMLTALVEGLHQPLTVDQVDRRAFGVLLGLVGEAACGDEESRSALVASVPILKFRLL